MIPITQHGSKYQADNPLSQTTRHLPKRHQRVYGIAAASGAAFGGLLADSLGWRWEFGIQLLPLTLCFATAVLGMPADLGLQKGERKQTLMQALRGFDTKGSVLLTTSTTFLILGLVSGRLPFDNPGRVAFETLLTMGSISRCRISEAMSYRVSPSPVLVILALS